MHHRELRCLAFYFEPKQSKRTAKDRGPALKRLIASRGLPFMGGDITAEWKLRGGGEWLVDPRSERPAVLAFDVAAKGGVFEIGADGGWFSGEVLDAKDMKGWARRVAARVEDFHAETCRGRDRLDPKTALVVVEDTNVGFAKVTPIAALAGARYVGGVVALASAAGLPVLRVPAQTWQLAMLTPDRKRLSRADGKAASRALATSHFGAAITSEDVADAACLALWARGGRP